MKQTAPKTILVTGASGQLGNELKELSTEFPQYRFMFATKEQLPIEDTYSIETYFGNTPIQYCINCAAYTSVDKAETEKDLAFLINGTAVGELAKTCRLHQCKLLHISTDYVYDGSTKEPLREDMPVSPLNTYGKSKLKGEELALAGNPDSIIIRTSWVFSSYGKNFVRTMMKLMTEKNELRIVSDQVGCPTYAADLAKAIMLFVTYTSAGKSFSGIYNYANFGITTWFQFAQLIKESIGSNCQLHPVTTSQYPTPALRPLYSVLDTTKIKKDINPDIPFWKDSVAKCIDKILDRRVQD